jgi:phosphoglycolate phosphatase-like HAD superfamily hydrolase
MREARSSRVVIFDFDGTLADTWRDLATALNRTLADAGLPPVEGPQVQAWIGDGALKLLANALPASERVPERLEPHYERFRSYYDRCCLDTTELYPGMSACLEALGQESLAVLESRRGSWTGSSGPASRACSARCWAATRRDRAGPGRP